MAQKCNFFLQITTIFYKTQLLSTNRNYFLQTTTIFYKPQLFSTNCNNFLHSCNFFLQITTFFYKSQLFSTILQLFSIIHKFFLQITTFFHRRNKRVFSLGKREKRLVYHMCREDGKWIASAESRSVRGASHQPIFMGDCPTICHMYLPCLPGEWVSFCVPGAIAVSVDAA